jgi:hypothetical protein
MSGKKMTCTTISNKLIRLFDEGSLERLPEELQRHIDDCPNCQDAYYELTKLRGTLAAMPAKEPDEAYWINYLPRLRQRMEQVPAKVTGRSLAWAPSLTMAALFMILLLTSPVQIAPPTWYITQISQTSELNMFSYSGDYLTATELEELGTIWEDEEYIASQVDSTELYVIKQITAMNIYETEDPIDYLNQLDDETLEEFFKTLMNKSIIRS